MHVAVLDFFLRNVDCEEFNGKRVLEVGSKFVMVVFGLLLKGSVSLRDT
jgi:hypothetical protein